MSDETLSQDAAADEAGGQTRAPNMAVARAIARALWLPDFKAANPEAGGAEINAAWKLARPDLTRPVLQVLKTLQKRGYIFAEPDAAPDANSHEEAAGQA